MWKSWKRPALDDREDKTDYDSYILSFREVLICLMKSAAVTGAFAYMFYQSWMGFLAWPAAAYFGIRRDIAVKKQRRKDRLALQFKDTILAVTAGMQTGHSAENAFLEAEGEIRSLYGRESEMARELALLRKGLKNAVPLEKLLLNLGERSCVEEIRDFTEVFSAAKRLGGNLKEIIQRTAQLTQQRMEVDREIKTALAAKKYEQKVMMVIPFLLFGYMKLTSPGFFDVLYFNPAGVFVMTVCLILYLAAYFLAEKIMDIPI